MGLTDLEKEELIRKIAERVVSLRLTPVAIVLLESTKPLSFAFNQLLVFFHPIVTSIFNPVPYEKLILFFEDRNNIELLIKEIEKREDEYDRERKNKKNISN
ncbi:MAG: hypothetical protein N2323_00695 [candidate division WOR-3 bacterium]|nr:hypothetical protein [candidate division WOR-3 bacterium]MCX7836463.1 hypothetical protein [candidate division WOR-3 bacterium]MDW8114562.1 hypothetical protein [candidate division WOR-3 bacterium]